MKPTVLVARAEAAEADGNLEVAFDAWSQVVRHYKKPLFASRLAIVAEDLGRWSEAEKAWYAAMDLDRDNPVAYSGLGNAYSSKKNHPAAAYWFRQAASIGPTASRWILAGAHERMAGNDTEARASLRQALDLEPRNDEALYEMALTYVERDSDYESALPFIYSALEVNPTDATNHCFLGVLLSMIGELDQSLPAIEKSLELQPDDHWTWFHLGDVLLLADRLSEVEGNYRHALVLKPGFAPALTGLARLRLRQDRHSDAGEFLQQAINADPKYHEANFEYGKLLRGESGESAKAREYLIQAFCSEPTFGATVRKKEILKLLED